ncbi:DUF456 domain-containing protein [Prosthecobacter vanneervenii]|uniref:DUF456 domain-containing protein n=1 Tax=Prosthecobacter vanneervenii TaxID=48466 RepID=A0A7W7YEX3_9BACT|nr:DUF456 domain-containing protein [Prosthecobacter vanneervenii]MBB5034605.1 hypothetical protein [Prosthecobacter vanneervenii]
MTEWLTHSWNAVTHFFTTMPWEMWSVWTLTICLLIVGVIGSVVPFLPGPMLIFAAGIVHTVLRSESGMSTWGIVFLSLELVLSYVVDFASGAMGARWFGASKWGIAGVFIGGIAGMFFIPFGLVLGPLIGGVSFELVFAKKQLQPAAKSAWGSLLGTGVGLVLRLIVALLMVATFLLDALVW